jgi:hypothetical protein
MYDFFVKGAWPMRPNRGANPLITRETPFVPTTIMVPAHYKKMLRYLSDKTRIRQSEFMREAIRDLLIKYRGEFNRSEYEF